jgi:5'-3' exoribonuclease 1
LAVAGSPLTRSLANQNMFLLHLSLMREYLDLEFSPVANQIPFEYDLERIIDDFILMSIFVGNDFLPHLPGLHINEGALELIWKIYKEILPAMGRFTPLRLSLTPPGGYMNEHGTISLPRLQMMLDRLSIFEKDNFENEFSDVSWYKGNQAKEIAAIEKARKRGKMSELRQAEAN